MNRFTLMCDDPYTTCIRAEQELNKLMGEVDKLRQVKDRLLEENTRLKAERDKAVEDIDRLNEFVTFLLKDSDDICRRCKNHIECKGEDCDNYTSGIGATGQDGEEYLDFKWTCEDFDLGTCNKLQNTPCNGCFDDDYKGFVWRGLEDKL